MGFLHCWLTSLLMFESLQLLVAEETRGARTSVLASHEGKELTTLTLGHFTQHLRGHESTCHRYFEYWSFKNRFETRVFRGQC
jgi:hypothetical protein